MRRDLIDNADAILITGPTASGKSALAVELAARHGGVVINADSMQVYDILQVITARPSREDMDGVSHYLYGHITPLTAYSTGEWLRAVQKLLEELKSERRLPVFVGGTGLYFQALTGGLSDMPEISSEIRQNLRERLLNEGAEPLHKMLSKCDPKAASTLNPGDGQRIVRALEVFAQTGRSILDVQGMAGPMVINPAHARKLVLLPDRKLLHERINRRFEKMLGSGAVEEIKALMALGPSEDLPAMKAIGVRQIADMLEGKMTQEQVIERSAALTRQYAKRQMTWFRNQMDETWKRVT